MCWRMASKSDSDFDPTDNRVIIWKTPAPKVIKELRWKSAPAHPVREKYCCSVEVFGSIWIYDEEGLHLIRKSMIMPSAVRLDEIDRQTSVTLDEWLRHWNFWSKDYQKTCGQSVLAFRKKEYNAQGWSSVCFVEQACIKLGVTKPAWPPYCNLDLYTKIHTFNILSTKMELYPVKVWRTSTIHLFGIPLHNILNKLSLMDSIICPPGAYHAYIEVYGLIWEYGPQGLVCVLPDCSTERKNPILMQSGFTDMKLEEWRSVWDNFQTNTSFKSTANGYDLYESNCLTFLTYALNALGMERPIEIQELAKWMRQLSWHGTSIVVPGIRTELFLPPLSWIIKGVLPLLLIFAAVSTITLLGFFSV